MLSGGPGVAASGESPDPARGGEAVVLDPAEGDRDAAPGRAGDRCGSGVGLQRAGVGEPSAVVADLGQDAGAGEVGQAGEAGDDRVVGVFAEFVGGSLLEVVGACAGGVEGREQRQGLSAHGLLDQFGLAQAWSAQLGDDVLGQGLDTAFASGPPQRGRDAGPGQFAAAAGVGAMAKMART